MQWKYTEHDSVGKIKLCQSINLFIKIQTLNTQSTIIIIMTLQQLVQILLNIQLACINSNWLQAYQLVNQTQMFVSSVKVVNFKNYKNVKLQFHKHLNLILGNNGNGKSNLLRVFLFVFSNKIIYSNIEYINHVHRGVTLEPAAKIEVVFQIDVSKSFHFGARKKITIGRRWTVKGNDMLLIDGRTVTVKQFEKTLSAIGLNYESPYNFIQQGRVDRIIHMNQYELYKFLEEALGLKRYMKIRHQCTKVFEESLGNKTDCLKNMREIDQKLADLEIKREIFNENQKEVNYLKKVDYIELLESLHQTKLEKTSVTQSFTQWNNIAISQTKKKTELNQEIEVAENKIKALAQKIIIYKPLLKEVKNIKTNLPKLSKSIKEYKKQKDNLEEQLQRMNQKAQRFRNEAQQLKSKFESMRMDKQLKNTKKRNQMINNSIKSYDIQIHDLKSSLAKLQKEFADFKKQNAAKKDMPANQFQDLKTKKEKFDQIFQQCDQKLKKIDIEKLNLIKTRNALDVEKQSTQFQLTKEIAKANQRGTNTFLHTQLMDQLKRLQVNGIYGLIADHVTVHKQVAFAYEIAAKAKFFSILVSDDNVAKRVIDINKRIKGQKIMIFSLQFFRGAATRQFQYPKNNYTFPLDNKKWLKIKPNQNFQLPIDFVPCMQKLITTIVGKYVLVQTFAQALQISKENNLNAITAKGQLMKAGAVFGLIGDIDISKPTGLINYQKIRNYGNRLQQIAKENEQISTTMDRFDDEISDVKRYLKKIQNDSQKVNNQWQEAVRKLQINDQIKNKQEKLTQSMDIIKKEIDQKVELRDKQISKKEKQTNIKTFSTQEINNAQMEFKDMNKKLNDYLTEMFVQERKLNEIKQVLEGIQKRYAEEVELQEQFKIKTSTQDYKVGISIKEEIQKETKRVAEYHSLAVSITEEIVQAETQAEKYQDKLNFIDYRQKQIKKQMDAITKVVDVRSFTEQDERIQQKLKANPSKNKIFTKQDRGLFMKLDYLQRCSRKLRQMLKKLQKYGYELQDFMKLSEQAVHQQMEITIKSFISFFGQILQKLNPSMKGRIEVTTTQKRNRLKQPKKGLSVRIGLESQNDEPQKMRKMRELSGGQKSLVAIAFILSIQMCYGCMIYTFDEIDSALDPENNRRLSSLLMSMSKHSQYFVITFKNSLIKRALQNAKYFEVQSQARVSKVIDVNYQRAGNLIQLGGLRRISKSQDNKMYNKYNNPPEKGAGLNKKKASKP